MTAVGRGRERRGGGEEGRGVIWVICDSEEAVERR